MEEGREIVKDLNKQSREAYEKLKQNTYYLIVGIVSFIALVFLPMLGSDVGIDFNLPTSTRGWVVWITTRLIISTLNVVIFYSFVQQGKVNVRNEETYKEANKILACSKEVKKQQPRAPKVFKTNMVLKKGSSIFFFSALSLFAFSQAILTYDWMTMLGFIFTIIAGIVWGILNMKKVEVYWTEEYYQYALMIQEKEKTESAKAGEPVTPEELNKCLNSETQNSGT